MSDMFENHMNCNNLYYIESELFVRTCSDMFENSMNPIHIILNLNKFRHVSTCSDMFENHMNRNNSYHIESRQVQTCLRIIRIVTT